MTRRGALSVMVPVLLLLHATSAAAQWDAWFKKPRKEPRYPAILVAASSLPVRLPGNLVILDARPLAAFEAGHIPGAIHLDPRALGPLPGALVAEFRKAGVPAGRRVICYSDRTFPEAAGRLFWHLELAGRREVQVLNGGFDAWGRLGRPVERGGKIPKADPPATKRRATPERSGFADSDYVRKNFGLPGVTIMDWRSP